MIINVHVKEKVLEISLGSGEQTFRWLGLVVNARLKSSGLLKKSFEEECRTVLGFTNEEGNILDPTKLICNMVDDKANVFAQVTESLQSDGDGNPMLTNWQVSAYVHSDLGVQYYSAMEAYRERKQQEDEVEVVTSSSLLYVGDFSLEDITSAFELDWRQLNWSWLDISDSDFEYHDLKTILSQNYGLVCRIFSHYCGAGKVGEAYGMNLVEFSHLVHTTGAFHWKTHGKKIEDIFTSVITGDESAEGESKSAVELMSRCDLVYALVKVSLRNTKDQSENLIKAVKSFFTVQLNDTWEKELIPYFAHNSDSFLQKTLEQYSDYAKNVFKQYASRAKGCDVINVIDFKNIFVTMATVRQNDDTVINNAFLSPMPSNSEFDELCVSEFLEAVCHLAVAVVPDLDTDKITDVQKIRMLYQSIADFEINGGGTNEK
jgi:hypothetical protein